MSVELSDGHIKVSYDLGSGMASVVSNQNHNDGKWKSFTLSRIQKQGELLEQECSVGPNHAIQSTRDPNQEKDLACNFSYSQVLGKIDTAISLAYIMGGLD